MESKENSKQWGFVDLYCGGGGITTGLIQAGGEHIAGIDNYVGGLKHYNHNFHNPEPFSEPFDLTNSPSEKLAGLIKPHRNWLLVGGPPCQGFSVAGLQNPEDPRSQQLQRFLSVVDEMRPPGFFFENVPNVFGVRSGSSVNAAPKIAKHERYLALKEKAESMGYHVSAYLLLASDFGTPQNRSRVVFFGSQTQPVQMPMVTHRSKPDLSNFDDQELPLQHEEDQSSKRKITAGEAILDLPQVSKVPVPYSKQPDCDYQIAARGENKLVSGHLPTNHDPHFVKKIAKVKFGEGLYKGFNHAWIKVDPNKPARTIKMNNRAPGLHPYEPRSLSPRECARLQGFPDSYELIGTKTEMLTIIGNAVPPQLAEAAVKALIESLEW